MTIVVVDPADIREDSEAALLGLERMRGAHLGKIINEVYASRTNAKVGFWRSMWDGGQNHAECPRKYPHRQIALWVAELINPDLITSSSNPLDWWSDGGLAMKMLDQRHQTVRDLIATAASVNAQELHVEASTLRRFEEAYDVGSKPFDPEA